MPRTSQVELTGCPPFRALCFDNLGLIKVVEAQPDKGAPQVVARWGHPDSQQAAVCTSLSGDTYPVIPSLVRHGVFFKDMRMCIHLLKADNFPETVRNL
jgi:hypothetical protein